MQWTYQIAASDQDDCHKAHQQQAVAFWNYSKTCSSAVYYRAERVNFVALRHDPSHFLSPVRANISHGVDVTTGDDQTRRAQSSSRGRPRILSRRKEEDASLFDEMTHSQEFTSPDKRDDLISRRRSPSRLSTMTSTCSQL